MQRKSASPSTYACHYFIVHTIREQACALRARSALKDSEQAVPGISLPMQGNTILLRLWGFINSNCGAPQGKSLHENGSCSALRSGECNHWYLRTNKVAFHTALISAALKAQLLFFCLFFSCCVAFYVSKRHGLCTKLQSSNVFSNINLGSLMFWQENLAFSNVSLLVLFTSDAQKCYWAVAVRLHGGSRQQYKKREEYSKRAWLGTGFFSVSNQLSWVSPI